MPTISSSGTRSIMSLEQSSSSSSLQATKMPSLIVFDLDNTLWTPELYQLRKLQRMKLNPTAGKDVKLFPAIDSIIQSIRADTTDKWSDTKFAVASRTSSVQWAHHLLQEFDLYNFFDYIEIFPGNKKQHFANLQELSGIPYNEMIFFDDARDGKYGNCVPVSQLGVLSVHTPNGLYEEDIWTKALSHYHEWSDHQTPNMIIEWDNSISSNGQRPQQQQQQEGGGGGGAGGDKKRFEGVVQMVNTEKRFGFIRYGNRNTNDVFFHFNNLPANTADTIQKGFKISFTVQHDAKKGKSAAVDISVNGISDVNDNDLEKTDLHVFSMNLPFAALLANEYKTLETRNGTMFVPYPEGTKMLLHVGQRIYPDGDRHLDVMKSGGLDEGEIKKLKSLPEGFGKGMAVAICEIGKTYETTLNERCDPDFQRKVGAFGEDSGMRATEIKRVEYLKRGVKVKGSGGVFKANVPNEVIPDGWLD